MQHLVVSLGYGIEISITGLYVWWLSAALNFSVEKRPKGREKAIFLISNCHQDLIYIQNGVTKCKVVVFI